MAVVALSFLILHAAVAAAKGPADPFVKTRSDKSGTRYSYPRFKAVIDLPSDFTRVQPLANEDIAYEFAMRHKTAPYEIRLKFEALAETPEIAKERKECEARNRREPQSCAMADLETPSDAWGQVIAANMTDGRGVQFLPFPEQGVKREFAAEWGFVSEPFGLDARRGFNAGYQLGQVVVLHRRGVGKLYRIVLAGSIDDLRALEGRYFYGARFQGARPPAPPRK